MAGFEAPFAGWFYPTRNDARYPRSVTVYYPLHPLFGRENLPVRQRSGATSVAQVVVEFEQQRHAVPLWMTDQHRCSAMTIGFDPQCALSSLLALTSLIDAAEL